MLQQKKLTKRLDKRLTPKKFYVKIESTNKTKRRSYGINKKNLDNSINRVYTCYVNRCWSNFVKQKTIKRRIIMSKKETQSVREQLANGQTHVQYKTEEKDINLPKWMIDAGQVLDDENALIETLRSHGVLMGVLHKGLNDCLQTGVRAVARKSEKAPDGNEFPVIDSASAENFKPKPLPAPAKNVVQKLLNQGYTKQQIMDMLEE